MGEAPTPLRGYAPSADPNKTNRTRNRSIGLSQIRHISRENARALAKAPKSGSGVQTVRERLNGAVPDLSLV